jgi:hypothetical protein
MLDLSQRLGWRTITSNALAVLVVVSGARNRVRCGAACGGGPEPTDQPRIAIFRVPPPGRVELVPPQPRADAVWIDGGWSWTDRRWVLDARSLGRAPAGAVYSPWKVARGPDARLYFAPAAWRDARGNPIDPPPALVSATVTTVPVVNPDGTQARTIVKQE